MRTFDRVSLLRGPITEGNVHDGLKVYRDAITRSGPEFPPRECLHRILVKFRFNSMDQLYPSHDAILRR